MVTARIRIAAAALILMVGAGGIVAGATPPAPDDDAGRLQGHAAKLYAYLKKPLPGELKWQEIPWSTDLAESVRVAKEEKRPLLLFVSGDDPLERC